MQNEQDLTIHKENLEKERERLMKEIETQSAPQGFGGDIDAGDEKTDEAEEFANQLAIAQALKDRVQQIDDALGRLQEGKYGICLGCGGKIEKEVLSLAPESTLCEACKKKG